MECCRFFILSLTLLFELSRSGAMFGFWFAKDAGLLSRSNDCFDFKFHRYFVFLF